MILVTAGIAIPAMIATITMTTSNSISVKPFVPRVFISNYQLLTLSLLTQLFAVYGPGGSPQLEFSCMSGPSDQTRNPPLMGVEDPPPVKGSITWFAYCVSRRNRYVCFHGSTKLPLA